MENKIRIARKKKGYTQEELACRVGCSVKTMICNDFCQEVN